MKLSLSLSYFAECCLLTGHTPGAAVVKEVQGQHTILRDCIEQLVAMETSRTSLISHLREALQEQVSHFPPSLIASPAKNLTFDHSFVTGTQAGASP